MNRPGSEIDDDAKEFRDATDALRREGIDVNRLGAEFASLAEGTIRDVERGSTRTIARIPELIERFIEHLATLWTPTAPILAFRDEPTASPEPKEARFSDAVWQINSGHFGEAVKGLRAAVDEAEDEAEEGRARWALAHALLGSERVADAKAELLRVRGELAEEALALHAELSDESR
ncbi:MAG: hypothetical protein CME06_16815 [Gemmatimonadetes bacterium]|nr:hypothetical protein [Gemmatimonadota bacterium]